MIMRLIKNIVLSATILLPAHFGNAAADKYRYKTSGFGASTDFYWSDEGCSFLGSSANIYGQDQVNKYKSNGKPSVSTSEFVSVNFNIWTSCNETHASRSYLAYYPYDEDLGATMSVNVDQTNLATASISFAGNSYILKEVCNIQCIDWDEDGQTDYCFDTYCETDAEGYLPVELSVYADLTAIGPAETQKFTSSYRTINGYYRSTSTDRSRPAAPVSFVINLGDGDVIEIPTNAETNARIFKTKSGEVSVYRGF